MAMVNRVSKPNLHSIETVPPAPPHAIEAEQGLLGVVLLASNRLPEVEWLAGSDFYRDDHRRIWRHILEMAKSGEAIDALTVSDRIQQWNEEDQTGGLSYLLELAGAALPNAQVDAYARLIRDRAARRRLMAAVRDIEALASAPSTGTGPERLAAAQDVLAKLSESMPLDLGESESILDTSRATLLDRDAIFTDELIEDVLSKHGVACIYGASNSGKTFYAIDMAGAVARGVQWMDKNTSRCAVLYLATESPASVKARIAAYMAHHGLKSLDVFVAGSAVNLFDSEADVGRILEEIQHINKTYNVQVGLIIGDTMARIAAGANENSGEDMGVVMANADKLVRGSGCAFVWIHHAGKDEAKGARGWSGIRAHIDTEIEVKDRDESGIHAAEITKQRDLGGKGTRFGFSLQVVKVGINAWGNARTTCVLVPENAPAKQKGGRPNEGEAAVLMFLMNRGSGARSSDIVDGLDGILSRPSVYRAIGKLKDSGKLECVSGIYAVRG